MQLRLLGSIELRDPQGMEVRPVLAQPKRLALLAYLAAAPANTFHRRDTLLALFWPDQDTVQPCDAGAIVIATHDPR